MDSIRLHLTLSTRRIPANTRDSAARQERLPPALSPSSQDHRILATVQLQVLGVLSQDKDLKIQDQGSGLAWELEES